MLLQAGPDSLPRAVYTSHECSQALGSASPRARLVCQLLPSTAKKSDIFTNVTSYNVPTTVAELDAFTNRPTDQIHHPQVPATVAELDAFVRRAKQARATVRGELEIVESLDAFWSWAQQWPSRVERAVARSRRSV